MERVTVFKNNKFVINHRSKKYEKAILITGATGLIGSHVYAKLLKKNYRLISTCSK